MTSPEGADDGFSAVSLEVGQMLRTTMAERDPCAAFAGKSTPTAQFLSRHSSIVFVLLYIRVTVAFYLPLFLHMYRISLIFVLLYVPCSSVFPISCLFPLFLSFSPFPLLPLFLPLFLFFLFLLSSRSYSLSP